MIATVRLPPGLVPDVVVKDLGTMVERMIVALLPLTVTAVQGVVIRTDEAMPTRGTIGEDVLRLLVVRGEALALPLVEGEVEAGTREAQVLHDAGAPTDTMVLPTGTMLIATRESLLLPELGWVVISTALLAMKLIAFDTNCDPVVRSQIL